MSVENTMPLFTNSTAIIVDDEVNKRKRKINIIKHKFSEMGISFVCCEEIPEKKLWDSYHSLSFIIVDWRFNSHIPAEVTPGAGFYEAQEKEIMDFIEYIYLKHFMPIFILSQEHIIPIKEKLKTRENLKNAILKKQIVVMRKNRINVTQIQNLINNWCINNPAVYTLKSLDNAIQLARNELLSSLNKYDKQWPLIVYQTIKNDNPAELNDEYSEFLINNLMGRIPSICYDKDILGQKYKKMDRNQIIELYSNAKIHLYTDDDTSGCHTGDIYLFQDGEQKEYIINITAGCDLRKGRLLYLRGKPYSIAKEEFNPDYGLLQRNDRALIPSFFDNECIEFKYRNYDSQKKRNNYHEITIKENNGEITKTYNRVGKLLHPYITFVQEGFSNFICRTGMMRHPNEAFTIKEDN